MRLGTTLATRLLIAAVTMAVVLIVGTGSFMLISRDQQTRGAAQSNADNRSALLRQLVQRIARPEDRVAADSIAAQPAFAGMANGGPGVTVVNPNSVPVDTDIFIVDAHRKVVFTAANPTPGTAVQLNAPIKDSAGNVLILPGSSAPGGLQTITDALATTKSEGVELLGSSTPVLDVSSPLVDSANIVRGAVVVVAPMTTEMARFSAIIGYPAAFIIPGSPASEIRLLGGSVKVGTPSADVVAQLSASNATIGRGIYQAPVDTGGSADVAGSFSPIAAPGVQGKPAGYVGVEIPLSDFAGAQASDQRTLIVLMVVAILVTGLGCLVFVNRYVRRPVARLEGAVARIAAGDLSRDVPVSTGDELGRLAGSVNNMRARLATLIANLQGSVVQLREVSHALTAITEGIDRMQLAIVSAAAAVVPDSSAGFISFDADNKAVVGTMVGTVDPAGLLYDAPRKADLLGGATVRGRTTDGHYTAFPMTTQGRVGGALLIESKAALSDHDVSVLDVIAGNAAVALQNVRLLDQETALLQQIIDTSEQERTRIARDLHDGVVSNLAGVAYELAATAAQHNGHPAGDRASQAVAEIQNAMRDLRTLIVDIAPPDLQNAGLEVALTALLEPIRRAGMDAEMTTNGDLALPVTRMALIHRVAQETLRNVIKHSGGHSVTLDVRRSDDRVVLTVHDDGKGFSKEDLRSRRGQGHVGLGLLDGAVKEAGATLRIDSAPGEGTTVTLEVPAR